MTDESGAAPRKWLRRREVVAWSEAVAEAICERVAAGELLYEVCREEGMPTPQSVARWARERTEFGEALEDARRLGGRGAQGGGVWTYCAETAEAIFHRLCAGETLTAICADPAMPCQSTVYSWRRRFRDFDDMLRLAAEIQAERYCDMGLELAMGATPETAYLTDVRLKQLRWMAGVRAPRKYRVKMVEPETGPEVVEVSFRHFRVEPDPETGRLKVVAYFPNPRTGEVEREDAPGWRPPPGVRHVPG